MWIANISDTSIEYLDFEKSRFGGFIGKSAGRIEIKEGEKPEDKLPEQFKNKHLAICIPDTKVFLQRLKIPAGFIGPALSSTILNKVGEMIPVSTDDLIFDYVIIQTDKKSHIKSPLNKNKPDSKMQTVLFIAVPYQIFASYFQALQKINAQPALFLPESITVFNFIKDELTSENAIVYIDVGAKTSIISFFDEYGPISTFSEPVETQKLEEETLKVIDFFKKKYSEKVEKVILAGGGSLSIDPDQFGKVLKLPVTKAESILQKKLDNLKIKISTDNIPQTLFLNTIGLGLLANQETTLNLAKKEVMENIINGRRERQTLKERLENTSTPNLKNDIQINRENQVFTKPSIDAEGIETLDKPNKTRTFILLFVLIALMGLTFLAISSKKPNKPKLIDTQSQNTKIPASSQTPSPQPTSEVTPTSVDIDRKNLKIQLLNGTTVRGLAGKTSDFLKEKGYENITTGNANNFSYTKTSIEIKKERKKILETLVNDLEEQYKIGETNKALANDSEYDVIIIIGQ